LPFLSHTVPLSIFLWRYHKFTIETHPKLSLPKHHGEKRGWPLYIYIYIYKEISEKKKKYPKTTDLAQSHSSLTSKKVMTDRETKEIKDQHA
jgi:hypothetical protein